MIDEGYTKFAVHWTERRPLDHREIGELERWRRPLFEAGLVGHYPELGIGYGNISIRTGNGREFLISGTQTGHLACTGRGHYALVTEYDIDGNSVHCRGAVQASSETLTHAALYELDPAIRAVAHVHDEPLWLALRGHEPTTDAAVAYGTPEMAREFVRLFRDTRFAERRLAVMGGHESGLVAVGSSLREAVERVLAAHRRIAPRRKETVG
ncbi:MAG TPA: class II aldolase/adducin family protein [Woeseiaceae bacterium]|nr:class II aldolase/adducin family protein [Woeseiaceae bacterium]